MIEPTLQDHVVSRRAVVLFTRAPEAEARVKGLPAAEGAALFTGFLGEWRQRAAQAGAELLVVTPTASCAALQRILPDATVAPQHGDTFAARLEAAFALAFTQGASSVVMVGGDGPALALADLEAAFSHLHSPAGAMFLVPSADGGVNAIGLNHAAQHACAGVVWQDHTVCGQLTAAAQRLGAALRLAGCGFDLDSPADVARAYRTARRALALWAPFRQLLLAILLSCRVCVSRSVAWASAVARLTLDARGPPALLPLV